MEANPTGEIDSLEGYPTREIDSLEGYPPREIDSDWGATEWFHGVLKRSTQRQLSVAVPQDQQA